VVKNVEYNEHEDNFKVVVKNCSEDRVMAPETFDMVFVASGKLNQVYSLRNSIQFSILWKSGISVKNCQLFSMMSWDLPA